MIQAVSDFNSCLLDLALRLCESALGKTRECGAAGMLDRVGTVCLAVGAVTPVSTFVIGAPQVPTMNLFWLIGSGVVWTAMFIALHQAAQNVLEDLHE